METPADRKPPASDGFARRGWRRYAARMRRRPFVAAWQGVAAATFVVTLVSGALVRVTDPGSFTSLADGMWWAVQTVTTVGYGDVLPASLAGRLVAVLVMMFGLAFLTVTTAAVGSLFAESTRRRAMRECDDPLQEEVERLHARLDEVLDELHALRGRPRD